MSGSYYTLNAKYNQLLALINAGGGGGGGSVNNPMTTNLDGGGFSILNINNYAGASANLSGNGNAANFIATNTVRGDTVDAVTKLTATDFNSTNAPSYSNLGAIAVGNYEIASIEPKADAEGSILGVLRALDAGLKHTVFFQVIGYADRAVIRVINNVAESDTPIFVALEYGEDNTSATRNILSFTCGTPSATCEMAIYQNQGSLGTGASYGSPFVPATSGITSTFSSTYASTALNINYSGTSANFQVDNNLFAKDTDTLAIQTNTLATWTDPEVSVLSDTNYQATSSIKQTASIQTNEINSTLGSNIAFNANLDIKNNNIYNSLNDFVAVDDNLDMLNHGITNISTLAGNGASAIVSNSVLDMNSNSISGADQVELNTISKSAGVIDIVNPVSLGANSIQSSFAPSLGSDLCNKTYVDATAGSSGVQNPMLSNLDGGAFNISNVTSLSSNTYSNSSGGNIFSNGYFAHGGIGATTFGVGGQEIILAPSTEITIKNFGLSTTYFKYDQSSQTLSTENGATQTVKLGGIVDFEQGSQLILSNTPAPTTTPNDFNSFNQNNIDHFPQYCGTVAGTPNIPMTITPSFVFNVYNGQVEANAPFDSGVSWDNNSDGNEIELYDSGSVSLRDGLPTGVNNNDVSEFPFEGWLVGFGISNPSQLGGWICTGSATVEVVYYNFSGGTSQSFIPPVYIAGGGAGAFNRASVKLPQTNWARCDLNPFTGIRLSLKLNIPVGDTIDIQDAVNNKITCNKAQIASIPLI